MAFIKLIRFYRPRLEYERAECNYLWRLYENEVIPLFWELRLADETKRPPRFEAVATRRLQNFTWIDGLIFLSDGLILMKTCRRTRPVTPEL